MSADTLELGALAPHVRLSLRNLLAVGLGNALEFYDFVTFAYFAVQIGHAFFPASQTTHGLLFSLAAFGVGFVTRPLGALIIGRYGDRAGRKPAMLWSFALMGVSIVGLALTPSYAHIGIAAPVMLVLFRLLQGLALGGEVGPSAAFLVEAAPAARRGLYMAVWLAAQYLAGLAAGVIGFLLSAQLSEAQLDQWGWRIAFLIGAAVVPIGLYVRSRLPETLPDAIGKATVRPRVPGRFIALTLMLMAAGVTSSYVVDYMGTFVQDSLKLGAHFGFGATIVESLCGLCAVPIAGLLSDQFGRRPITLAAMALLIVLVIPCYLAMLAWRSPGIVYLATAVLAVLSSTMILANLTTIAESLPTAVRSAGLGILYAVAVAVFGGFSQFMIKLAMDVTGSSLAPAWYLMAALLIGAAGRLALPESAPCATAS